MLTGQRAITALETGHPGAHKHFGDFASAMHFSQALSMPGIHVFEYLGCWVFLQETAPEVLDFHMFCPLGARMGALRGILGYAFHNMGARLITGTPAPSNRKARVIAVALGFERDGSSYFLTPARFAAYTVKKQSKRAV